MSQWEWEHIPDQFDFNTWRMKVPGGWLIRTANHNTWDTRTSCTVTFIPDGTANG